MGNRRRRQVYFTATALHDGTVLSGRPVRKPSPESLRLLRSYIDADGVGVEFPGAGRELSDTGNETRTRFQDIIAVNLNTRRAIRDLVLPQVAEVLKAIQALNARMGRMESILASLQQPVPSSSRETDRHGM